MNRQCKLFLWFPVVPTVTAAVVGGLLDGRLNEAQLHIPFCAVEHCVSGSARLVVGSSVALRVW